MSLRIAVAVAAFASSVLVLVPSSAYAADGGADAADDGATDAASDGATTADASTDAASDATTDASDAAPPVTSDGGPITFRPDAEAEPDAGTPATPTDDGGCNAGGSAALASWPLALGVLALARRRRARRA